MSGRLGELTGEQQSALTEFMQLLESREKDVEETKAQEAMFEPFRGKG